MKVFLRPVLILSLLLPLFLQAQSRFHGVLLEKNGKPIKGVEVHKGYGDNLAVTDSAGKFSFLIPELDSFSFVGFTGDDKVFGYRIFNSPSKLITIDTIFRGQGMQIKPSFIVEIEIGSGPGVNIVELLPQGFQQVPTIGGGIESIIKSLGGVSSGNELSSQYNVRGGNFDENLIYVNDIEIYRPQIIHSGQQEGLSFLNADMVKSLKFSAGGFEAQYGDKMSSVLDVTYKRPDTLHVSANASLMLNTLSIMDKKKRFSYIAGMRYFTNSLLTRSLDINGAYRMNFGDFQTLIHYDITKKWSIEFLGNIAANRYSLYPTSRSTEFGTVSQAYQLQVFMAGAENMRYDYAMGAITVKKQIKPWKELKWIFAATGTNEQEYFDVEGAYNLNELDRDIGSKNLGKPLKTLGYGYFLDHGRNRLQTKIYNFSHIGTFGSSKSRNIFKYGFRVNYESINDVYREWRYNDSAGYNIPPFGHATDSIVLDDLVFSKNSLQSFRVQGFLQNRQRLSYRNNLLLTYGVRAHWWQVSNQLIATPRASLSWEPNRLRNKFLPDSLKKNDYVVRLSAGGYYQPGFYRELRGFDGKLNKNFKAQESWHFVAGTDRYFNLWDRRFKFTTEGYYKTMKNLDPYLYDNIRIRYYANNNSQGYAWGVDNRINGEFIKGLESWFTLSVLQTKEKITYQNELNKTVTSAWLRRPTDRRVNFAAVFQDQLPGNSSIRMNLNLLIGTGTPYFLNGKARYSATPSAVPPYRRLDLGISKVFVGEKANRKYLKGPFSKLQQAWVALEVFNILAINNVIAYSWVKDIANNTYGVPEYLTGRRLNLRIHIEF